MSNLVVFTYKISSRCGSYFGSYLQRVVIVATTREEADDIFNKECDVITDRYIEVNEEPFEIGIIDTVYNSDY